jgi:DNA-binding MarR family transcriptional regulator
MLLDLYASHHEAREVSVTSASMASGAPVTTGLRWLRQLEAGGLVARTRSIQDQRFVNLSLTEEGLEAVEGLLRRFASCFEARSTKPAISRRAPPNRPHE